MPNLSATRIASIAARRLSRLFSKGMVCLFAAWLALSYGAMGNLPDMQADAQGEVSMHAPLEKGSHDDSSAPRCPLRSQQAAPAVLFEYIAEIAPPTLSGQAEALPPEDLIPTPQVPPGHVPIAS